MLHPFNLGAISRADSRSRSRRVELRSFPLAAFVFMNALRPPLIGRRALPPSLARVAQWGKGRRPLRETALSLSLPPLLSAINFFLRFWSVSSSSRRGRNYSRRASVS